MTLLRKPEVWRVALWASLAYNVGVFLSDLWLRQFTGAAMQSVVIVALASWLKASAVLYRRLDAQLGNAVAQRRMTELALKAMKDGIAGIEVSVSRGRDAVN